MLLTRLKENKRLRVDQILFTKWDRFSRNAGDAYQMISILRKAGIEPQAIEQPLDIRIPENKIMLAFYLAAPEVENDRRALNVFHGMRRAKKEGRWVATAPIGYRNSRSLDGKKIIEPDQSNAPIIKWVFEELALGRFNTEQVWKQAVRKGLKCSKNNIGAYLKHILTGHEHLSKLYKSGTLEEKRQIIGSIFPENLTFDGMEHRTARLNEGIDLIYQITSKLRTQKRDKCV